MSNLNDEQKEAVFDYPNGVIINASPGTGKTKTLVSRATHKLESIPKYKKLALITYTNAGTDEISSRLVNKESVFIGTIHRFCLQFILRPYSWLYSWGKLRVISYEEQLEFLEINSDIRLGDSPVDELNKIKRNIDGSFDTNMEWNHDITLDELIRRYTEYLEDITAIDFNEILYRSYKIINENDFVLKSLSNKFYEILIDEFQDTNLFQYEIFKKINEIDVSTFFMVGDEKQKILSFAGAIDGAFSLAQNDFRLPISYLLKTYRSTNNIVDAYSLLFDNHPVLENFSVYNSLNIPLQKKEFDYRENTLESKINSSVEYLVEECNIDLEQIAILSKTWFDAYNVSKFLRSNYNIVGLGALPHSMTNVKNSTFDLLKSLVKFKVVSSIKNLKSLRRSFESHLNENNIAFSREEQIVIFNSLIKSFREVEEHLTLKDGLNEIQNIFDELLVIEHNTFSQIISSISEDEIDYWNIEKYFRALSNSNGILSTTIHQSKGLEFDAVILNQMSLGKVPHQNYIREERCYENLTVENLEEGRRVFYVGLSRAKKYLIITHNRNPSMFVNLLNENDCFE
ncbi:UvrD-helicase domain-containing protein [Aliarcobacter butzleri]|uniref:UvrD-helicase domain-containing protein n=1 Tax=Aliarcobacter butzleri TaxID=28197 RepID=UPI00263C7692|nr:ATP-dependent helicase [Aliarcobacter butzleri]MDN5069027.1 ATP-dependent helicase [Aliarcobacter butzleri]